MKVIIAGSRSLQSWKAVKNAVKRSGFEITEVVSGGAFGIDMLGEKWAAENNIPIKQFRPDWKKYGRSAGPIRNKEMAKYADALIAIWDKKSKGTKNMILTMRSEKKPIRAFAIKKH